MRAGLSRTGPGIDEVWCRRRNRSTRGPMSAITTFTQHTASVVKRPSSCLRTSQRSQEACLSRLSGANLFALPALTDALDDQDGPSAPSAIDSARLSRTRYDVPSPFQH